MKWINRKQEEAGNQLILKMAGALQAKALKEAERHNVLASQAVNIQDRL